jgi:hypothetical protein
LSDVYPALHAKSKHTVVKPGDRVAMRDVEIRIVASAGEAIRDAVPGAGQANPLCAAHQPKDADPSENAQSVGSHFTFGRFRALHLGDLTWNKEFALACPRSLLGTVDLFVVTHHGQPVSNPPVLVHALAPRVAIMNNGTRKGGNPTPNLILVARARILAAFRCWRQELRRRILSTFPTSSRSMPIQPIAARHRAQVPRRRRVAAAFGSVSARDDGSFTVTNTRNGFSKSYAAGRGSR